MSANAQYVTIPDANFVSWLNNNGYASCMNGNQMDTTCNAVINATTVNCASNNISDLTGISYFDNLITLGCTNNQLTALPGLPASLNNLYCDGNYLLILPTLPPALISLNCEANQLTSLPAIPASLNSLVCGDNQLTSFPTIPSSLQVLHCNDNLFTTLPTLPNSLTNLDCASNDLTSLSALPATLTNLRCQSNILTSLPGLPASLGALQCEANQLTALPSLPLSLYFLDCGGNPLTVLPALPPSLSTLACWGNQLTSLQTLPASLIYFDCSNNQLNMLPSLPGLLRYLYCSNTQLTSLPLLPTTLNELYCDGNQLTSLPVLPSSLTYLECRNNLLTSLPALPSHMDWLAIQDNPNLTCLPPIDSIDEFNWYGTAVSCMPNIIYITVSALPPVTSFPLCDLINQNNCTVYWNLSGRAFTDANTNCVVDSNEFLQNNIKLNLYQGGSLLQQTFSDEMGRYSFDTDTGNYTYSVDTSGLPVIFNCPIAGFYATYVTSANSLFYNKDFSLECKPGFDVGVSSVVLTSGIFRPANFATVNVSAGDMSNLYNLHCAAGVNGTVRVIINGPASFSSIVAGALTPVVNGDTLIYTIADFGLVNMLTDFGISVQTDTTAQLGSQVCFNVTVLPLTGDNNTTNNNYTHCYTVVNSYDPNDKQVSPSGITDTSQHELTYTIRFQNTGNAPAQHIYILDTLDNDIDESSIQLLAYSHEPLVQVIGNVMKFNFPNINLVDSVTYEPNSHGYVQYRVKLNDGLVPGTVINNTAYIYFDFNSPVVTNTTFNQVDIVTDLTLPPRPLKGEMVADIYPNPIVSGGELKIVFSTGKEEEGMLAIYDMSGRKVFAKSIFSSSQSQKVGLPLIAAGVYECVVSYAGGKMHKKMVISEKR